MKNIFWGLLIFSFFTWDAHAYYDGPCCRPIPKWYAGISGGVAFLKDTDIHESAGLGVVSNLVYDMGYHVAGQLGYRLLPYARVELEIGYRANELSSIDGVSYSSGTPNTSTRTSTLAFMANGYIDLPLHKEVIPYFGAGIGKAKLKVPLILTYIPTSETHEFEDWVLAYQFMAGANFPVPNSPFEFTIGYRYFTTQKGEVIFTTYPGGDTFNFSNASHNIELGGRLNF